MARTTAIDSEHVVPNPFALAVEILYIHSMARLIHGTKGIDDWLREYWHRQRDAAKVPSHAGVVQW